MAIVKCKECKKEVSDRAKDCPYCGVKEPGVDWKEKIIRILVFAAIAYGLYAYFSSEEVPKEQTATPEQTATIITAEGTRLVEAYCYAMSASTQCKIIMRLDTEKKIENKIGGKFRDKNSPYDKLCTTQVLKAINEVSLDKTKSCKTIWEEYGCHGSKEPKLLQDITNKIFCQY